jgi:hypothetical protein
MTCSSTTSYTSAAERTGKMPKQGQTAGVYDTLAEVLKVDNA